MTLGNNAVPRRNGLKKSQGWTHVIHCDREVPEAPKRIWAVVFALGCV